MELDLCVVLLFGLCVSNVINAESTGKVSEEKYTYTKFEGYDIEMEQTKNLHGREIAKIKSHNKKSSDLIDRCKDKCSHEYEDDCNIVIYKPDENQCLLMDCGENAGNCYFISSEDSKASGKGEGNTIILQRTEEKEQPEVKGPSDTKKSEPKSSEEDDEDESTTAEAAVQTQKRKEGEVVVGNSKPAQAESDPFSFPASPNDDGSDPAIQGPFEENSTVPQCEQPQRVGPCRAAIPRFFYDKETKACVAFIFGGCNANENNFKTNEECIRACGNKDGVKYFNTNNQQHNLSPYNSAHRGLISTHGSSNLNTAYKLEALIPLFAGSMISLLMIIMIGFRCYVNSKTGPKKLRKMIYDGPPPTVGEFLTDDEIVNGMYT